MVMQSYRQEAAESGRTDCMVIWVDVSTHAQCFNGMVRSAEGCVNCHSLDHISGSCPWRPHKRPSGATPGPPAKRGSAQDKH